jgi:hypothetical protein
VIAQRGDHSASKTDRRRAEGYSAGAESIHEHTTDQRQQDVGQAVDGVQRSDLRIGKPKFTSEKLGDRPMLS